MIRSMTGFARRERQFPWGLLAWELKTVNHRFLEIGCRLPEEFRIAEADFRQTIAGAVRRGKVESSLHFRPAVVASSLEVDGDLLVSLTLRAQQVASQAGSAARIDVMDLLRWPGVVREHSRDAAPLIAAAHALLAEALVAENFDVRAEEGGLASDLHLPRPARERADRLLSHVERGAKHAHVAVARTRGLPIAGGVLRRAPERRDRANRPAEDHGPAGKRDAARAAPGAPRRGLVAVRVDELGVAEAGRDDAAECRQQLDVGAAEGDRLPLDDDRAARS